MAIAYNTHMRHRLYCTSGELNPFLRKICAILNERNLTPTSLSVMAGLGSSTLSNLIKRNNVPTFTTLEKVCAVLGISLSSFIKSIEDEDPQIFANARSGIKRYDPLSKRKKQIADEISALPINDRDEMLKQILEKYGAPQDK